VAIASQKGGVGKTTTAINLGAGLALRGRRVLLVDLDPQANASSGLGLQLPARVGVADVLSGVRRLEEARQPAGPPNLDVLPSGGAMRVLEQQLVRAPGLIGRGPLPWTASPYQHILLDCPPSLGPLSTWALGVADTVLVPVQCEYYAMEGLAQVVDYLGQMAAVGKRRPVLRILLTMFDPGIVLAREVAGEIRRFFGRDVFGTVIPRDVALSEAPGHGRCIFEYDIRSCGAWAYLQLTREVVGSG